jgi:hypothetical protein
MGLLERVDLGFRLCARGARRVEHHALELLNDGGGLRLLVGFPPCAANPLLFAIGDKLGRVRFAGESPDLADLTDQSPQEDHVRGKADTKDRRRRRADGLIGKVA